MGLTVTERLTKGGREQKKTTTKKSMMTFFHHYSSIQSAVAQLGPGLRALTDTDVLFSQDKVTVVVTERVSSFESL